MLETRVLVVFFMVIIDIKFLLDLHNKCMSRRAFFVSLLARRKMAMEMMEILSLSGELDI